MRASAAVVEKKERKRMTYSLLFGVRPFATCNDIRDKGGMFLPHDRKRRGQCTRPLPSYWLALLTMTNRHYPYKRRLVVCITLDSKAMPGFIFFAVWELRIETYASRVIVIKTFPLPFRWERHGPFENGAAKRCHPCQTPRPAYCMFRRARGLPDIRPKKGGRVKTCASSR
jgi:hypothetical protein